MHITFLFYNGMTALDAIGPYEVLTRIPGVLVQRVSLHGGLILTSSDLTLLADNTLADVSHTNILVVPGAGNATALREYPEILAWIKKIHNTTIWTTSVCTGSLILGAAGLLSGLEATSHWGVMDRLESYGAIPVHKRIVEAGKIITAAGVSAGIDMGLMLAGKIAGQEAAETIQLAIEYDPEPPFNSGSVQKASTHIVNILNKRYKDKFEPR